MRKLLVAWVVMLCWVATASAAGEAAAGDGNPVLVFGAASLTNVLDDLSQSFTAKTHIPVKSSLAASSVLAKQIEAGAPADVFFSADLEWVDYVEQRKLLQAGSRHDVVGNRLVLIAPADSKANIRLAPGADL